LARKTPRQQQPAARRRAGGPVPAREPTQRDNAVGPSGGASPQRGEARKRRLAAPTCGWCGGPISVKLRGRIPTWCSPACRQRAWEQKRAAASGLASVRVVERRVEIPVPTTPSSPRHGEWTRLLGELATELDGFGVYDRELPGLTGALNDVLAALDRRTTRRR